MTKHKYQIDQSGKIEQTNKLTIIAFSNKNRGSILLSSKNKKVLQEMYRKVGKPRMFVLQVFSALIYYLVEKYRLSSEIIFIDKEYPGHENLIRSYIIQLSQKNGLIRIIPHNIRFEKIGKSSKAHGIAFRSYKKRKADNKVSLKEVLKLVFLIR